MTPFFSIIIPLYNKEKHIKATLMSVLSQTFQNFEIIVINDGSTDQSAEVVESIPNENIKMFTIQNQGVSKARNYGIHKATSQLLVFLDADDLWMPHHLEDLKSLYQNFPNCGLYATAYVKQFNSHKMTSVYNQIPTSLNWSGIVGDYFESSFVNAIAWTTAVMVPRSTINSIGDFDEQITLGAGEDTDLWIRIALKYPVAFCNKVSAIHNLHSDNRISNANTDSRKFINLDKFEEASLQNKSLKKYLDLNRYAIAIQYKVAGNDTKSQDYIDKIDLKNLNSKQRFLLQSNRKMLKLLTKAKSIFRSTGIHLSSFD